MKKITFKQIGIIYSPFETKDDCPIQSVYSSDTRGTVEVYEQFAEGLKDIESFSHIILLYEFDRAGEVVLVRQPFLDDESYGIFASRHPCRPNGIALSVVKLVQRDGNVLHVQGIDVLDETPLIDIKPYSPKFDCFPEASNGWLESTSWREKPEGRE